jgi:ABC-type phosphate/phosphonate transport system substrate-binding protein
MPTPDLDHLMHHADLPSETQTALERAFNALTQAERTHAATPTLETAQALAQAENHYQIALANKRALSPKGA